MTVTPVGRRERKKLATRQALVSATLRLVAERGFDRVTVEDISEAADVAPRTFFNYFASKEDAVVSRRRIEPAGVRALVLARPAAEGPLAAVCAVLRELTLPAAEYREELLLRQQVIERHPALVARQLRAYAEFERAMVDAMAERLGHSAGQVGEGGLRLRVLVAAATAAARSAASHWMHQAGRVPLDTLLDEAFACLTDLNRERTVD